MLCRHCHEPLDPEMRSHAQFCSPKHRVAAHRTKRRAEAAERDALAARARELLCAQTEAIVSSDVERLDAVTAEAAAWLATLDD